MFLSRNHVGSEERFSSPLTYHAIYLLLKFGLRLESYCIALITDNDISFWLLKLSRLIVHFSSTKYISQKSCNLKGRIENSSVAFFKSVSISRTVINMGKTGFLSLSNLKANDLYTK